MHFLIADDSEGKMLMLKLLVEKSGIATKIVTAYSTEEAKRLIDAERIDAAFVDYYIPSAYGPSVISYLHAANPTAHIALVSSSENSDNFAEAIDAGAQQCICTSYAEDAVHATILNLLEEWKIQS